jgi:hypothetical protein
MEMIKTLGIIAFFRIANINFNHGDTYDILLHHSSPNKCEERCMFDERCGGYLYIRGDKACYLQGERNDFQFFAVSKRTIGGVKIRSGVPPWK